MPLNRKEKMVLMDTADKELLRIGMKIRKGVEVLSASDMQKLELCKTIYQRMVLKDDESTV